MPKKKTLKRTAQTIGTKLYEDDYEYVLKHERQTYRKKSEIVATLVREAIKYRREKNENVLDPELKEALTPLSRRMLQKLDRVIELAEKIETETTLTTNTVIKLEKQNEYLANSVGELLKSAEIQMQNIILLRWINLFFNLVLFSASHPKYKLYKPAEWSEFVTKFYRQAVILKAAEINSSSFEEIEQEVISKKFNDFMKSLT